MGCFFLFHKWNGCSCLKCGETRHRYGSSGVSAHTCARCSKPNPDMQVHTLYTSGLNRDDKCRCIACNNLFHNWNGCKCTVCGTIRNEHDIKGCVCQKCGTEFHVFGPIKRNEKCLQYQECEKCGNIRKLTVLHDYEIQDDMKKSPCHIYRKCTNCGETIEEYQHDLEFDSFGESGWMNEYFYVCKVCGSKITEYKDNNSDW
jgi:hypothetical protein